MRAEIIIKPKRKEDENAEELLKKWLRENEGFTGAYFLHHVQKGIKIEWITVDTGSYFYLPELHIKVEEAFERGTIGLLPDQERKLAYDEFLARLNSFSRTIGF